MTVPPGPPEEQLQAVLLAAAELHRALGHATRLRLLQALEDIESPVGELAVAVGIEQPAASRHLAVLHGVGLLRRRRQGHHIYYCLASPQVLTLVTLAVDLAG